MITDKQFKRAMLYLQQELIQHLPDYVDVNLTSNTTIELTGDFDTIVITLSEDQFDGVHLKYETTYENARHNIVGNDSTLPDFENYPLQDQSVFHELLDLLNQQRGLRKYHDWLIAHGFTHKAPKHKDVKQWLSYEKVIDDLRVKVALSTRFDPDDQDTARVYTQPVKLEWPHGENKNEFYPRSINRLESAINNAVEEHQHRLSVNAGGRPKRTFL